LVHAAELSQVMLLMIGGVTAGYGTLKMWVQPRFKTHLAYSTISQMGFMMVQIGLTFYSLAILHMVGHAFYKAYQFLNSGEALSQVQMKRSARRVAPLTAWATLNWIVGIALSVAALLFFGSKLGLNTSLAMAVVIFVFGLTFAQIFLNSGKMKTSLRLIVSLAIGYLIGGAAFSWMLDGLPQPLDVNHPFVLTGYLFVSLVFSSLFFLQNQIWRIGQFEWGKRLYTRLLLAERYEG
ncbi:MAG: proton-conducting transporter membrane subunit, partial [Pseudomonadota bacterium]